MTEGSGQNKATNGPEATTPEKDPYPDPAARYTEYRVAALAATRKSELYTADKTKVDEKYKKLADSQKRFAEARQGQKKPWENLTCQYNRIKEAFQHAPSDQEKTKLEKCWEEVRPAEDSTKPTNCDTIPECDKLPKEITERRTYLELAARCVTRYDTEFDELAGFPENLSTQITDLTTAATKIEDDLAASDSDSSKRAYVEWLAFKPDYDKVNQWFNNDKTPAEYASELKRRFVVLLKTHTKWICLQVAVYAYEEKEKIEKEAREASGGSLVDLVLECALRDQKQAETPTQSDPTQPAKQSDQSGSEPGYEPEPATKGPQQGEQETPAETAC
jgi:hypothetical protein